MQALHVPSAKIFTHGGFFPQVGPTPGCTQRGCLHSCKMVPSSRHSGRRYQPRKFVFHICYP